MCGSGRWRCCYRADTVPCCAGLRRRDVKSQRLLRGRQATAGGDGKAPPPPPTRLTAGALPARLPGTCRRRHQQRHGMHGRGCQRPAGRLARQLPMDPRPQAAQPAVLWQPGVQGHAGARPATATSAPLGAAWPAGPRPPIAGPPARIGSPACVAAWAPPCGCCKAGLPPNCSLPCPALPCPALFCPARRMLSSTLASVARTCSFSCPPAAARACAIR